MRNVIFIFIIVIIIIIIIKKWTLSFDDLFWSRAAL